MIRFHVLVTPVENEAAVLTPEQAREGLAWLHDYAALGVITAVEAFPQTGGYMIIQVSSRGNLDALLSTYPLAHTVRMRINELVPLDDGFEVLLANIDRHAEVRT